jgi:hypothetical protein
METGITIHVTSLDLGETRSNVVQVIRAMIVVACWRNIVAKHSCCETSADIQAIFAIPARGVV